MKGVSVNSAFFSLRLIYKNMVWNRPKGALFGLIALALLLTSNFYFELTKILDPLGRPGQVLTVSLTLSALALWFFALPCVIYIIDTKHRPERIQRLAETIPQYYDSST